MNFWGGSPQHSVFAVHVYLLRYLHLAGPLGSLPLCQQLAAFHIAYHSHLLICCLSQLFLPLRSLCLAHILSEPPSVLSWC